MTRTEALQFVLYSDVQAIAELIESLTAQLTAAGEQLRGMREAASKIRHWHCWGENNEGMVVSAASVHALWEAARLTPTAAEQQAKANADKAEAWDATMADFTTGEMSTSLVHRRMMQRKHALRAAKEATDGTT